MSTTLYSQIEADFLANFISILNKFDEMLRQMNESKSTINYDELYHKVFKLNGYKSGLENVYNKLDYKRLYDRYLDLFGDFVDSTV